MGKIISSYECELINNKVMKDTIVLHNKKSGKLSFFDVLLAEAKQRQIAGLQVVLETEKRPVFSERELRTVMKLVKADKCTVNMVPMEDLLK